MFMLFSFKISGFNFQNLQKTEKCIIFNNKIPFQTGNQCTFLWFWHHNTSEFGLKIIIYQSTNKINKINETKVLNNNHNS